jgi:O-antigen/teichoic acid export membrane protein
VFTSILLARFLGAKEFGVYTYALVLVGLMGIIAVLGLPQLVIREVAIYRTRSDWTLIRVFLRWANAVSLLVSFALAILAAGLTWILAEKLEPSTLATLLPTLGLLPLTALSSLRTAALQGLHHFVKGQLPEVLVKLPLFIVLATGLYLILGKGRFSAAWAMSGQVAATAVAFLVGAVLLVRSLPQDFVGQAASKCNWRAWVHSAIPLLLIQSTSFLNSNADILILGALKGAESAGVYRAAARCAELVAFMPIVVNSVLAPTVSQLYVNGEIERLQRVITISARVVFFLSLAIALAFIASATWLLPTVFGHEFAGGVTALTILSLVQLINIGMGPAGLLLNMTGHERANARGWVIALALNVILNTFLIPRWGIEGAAMAAAVSLVTRDVLFVIWTRKQLNIHPTVLWQSDLLKRDLSPRLKE